MLVKDKYIIALLVRGEGSKIPLCVYPHEVEVLKALHSDAEIIVTEDTPPVLDGEFETEEEFERLQQYYRGNENVGNPTLAAYRKLSEFEDLFAGKEVSQADIEKAALYDQAKSLGIDAKKTWGAEKLQTAIDDALAN